MQHASTRQKGLGDRLEAVQMSLPLRQNLVAGLPCTEPVITDLGLPYTGQATDGEALPATLVLLFTVSRGLVPLV